eukprot:7351617-Prymnesium_polylepis.3
MEAPSPRRARERERTEGACRVRARVRALSTIEISPFLIFVCSDAIALSIEFLKPSSTAGSAYAANVKLETEGGRMRRGAKRREPTRHAWDRDVPHGGPKRLMRISLVWPS